MLFRKNIEKSCSYCAYAGKIDNETMLCRKKGFVASFRKCRRFRYDPLKRIPTRQAPLQSARYEEEDFSL